MPDYAPESQPSSGLPYPLVALLTVAFLAVLIRTAWISDDAAITLRTILNVTHGFGLTFNVSERVQTFTHPLWMALLTAGYLLTSHLYVATFGLSVLLSAYAFWRAVARAASPAQAAIAAIALFLSRAFVDFSTAGLENPLSCVLLAIFLSVFLDDRLARPAWLTRLWAIGALLYLTRPDDVLFVLPLLGVACWQVGTIRTVATSFVLGTLPASAWTIFAFIYYGFPFPNTAYAKLAMGIDRSDVWSQGVLYLIDSIDRDPLTLTVVAFAVVLGIVRRGAAFRALAAGLLVYLFYIVSIGGDFMTGRFLAVPLFVAVLLIGQLRSVGPARMLWVPAACILAVVGSMSRHVPIWSDSRYADTGPKPSGIVDERAVYFREKSLVLARRGTFRDPEWPRARRVIGRLRVLDTCGLMGASGLDFGPYTYLLDECALADPLLARLPAVFNPEWRTGHYRRMIPAGYRESVEGSTNLVEDPELHEYYEHLRTITRSESLWSVARLRTIAAMNLRAYDHLISQTYYRHSGSVDAIENLAKIRADETPWNAEGNHIVTLPLAVTCAPKSGRRYIEVSLDSDDRYFLRFLKGPSILSTLELGPIPEYRRRPGLTTYVSDIPPRAASEGFDTIVIAGSGGDNHYAIGHLLIEGYPATDQLLHKHVAIRDGMAQP